MIRLPLISRARGDAAEPGGAAAAPPGAAPAAGANPASAMPTGANPRDAEPAGAAVPREILRQVRLIELRTRGLVDSVFGGEYQSVFRGQGMEFAEVREYQPGDDVRNIDWNVTARSAVVHVKKHIEERELVVFLLLDLSGSEQFGTRGRFKAELAAEIAAVLALSAVRNNDRVGMLIFTDHVEHVVPARKGKRHVLRLIRDVLAFTPSGTGTDLTSALDFAARALPHRGIIFILSDFVPAGTGQASATAAWEKSLRLASRRHDIVAINIVDPAEQLLPDLGLVRLRDPETGRDYTVDTGDPAVREAFARRIERERADLRHLLRRLGIDEIRVRTGEPFTPPLLSFFRSRERKRVRA